MSRAAWAALLCPVLVCGCTDLPDIAVNTCGNGIVEQGEDCDSNDPACGKPTTSSACRLVCDPNGSPTAPVCDTARGYVCSLDGICRKPSGKFEVAEPISATPQTSVLAGDVDGNGIDDIVGMNYAGWLSVQYFESDGRPSSTFGFQTLAVPPLVGQLSDQDSIADLVHSPDFAVGVLRGTEERQPEPIAYSSLPVVNAGVAEPVYFAIEAVIPNETTLGYDEKLQDEILVVTDRKLFNVVPQQDMFEVPYRADELVPSRSTGVIPVGNLDERPGSPCDEFVLAKRGDTFVSVYTACAPGGAEVNTSADVLPRVTLPASVTVGETVLLTKLNPDDHLDLVIAGQIGKGELTPLFAAFGVGNGTFHSDPTTIPTVGPGDGKAALVYAKAPNAPRAAGDLNGDGIADFVLPKWIAFSTGNCAAAGDCWELRKVTQSAWGRVSIVDLNQNGLADIVAIRESDRYLDFWDGTGTGVFTPTAFALNGAVDRLAIGDFDGDFLYDIAINVIADPDATTGVEGEGSSRSDSMSVLFGRAHGPPDAPVSMGQLGTILNIVSGRYSFMGIDATTDLGVLSTYGGENTLSVALFAGRTSRQLQAPFALAVDTSSEPDRGYVHALGQFTPDDQHADIASFALRITDQGLEAVRAWLLPSTGDAELSTTTAKPSEQSLLGYGIDYCTILPVTVNLDQAGADEIVLFGRPDNSSAGSVIMVARAEGGIWTFDAPIAVPELTFNNNAFSRVPCRALSSDENYEPDLGEFYKPVSLVQAMDLDGDGRPEIVTLSGDDAIGPDKGVLNVFSTSPLDGQPNRIELPKDSSLRGFVVMNADTDPQIEIVLATDAGTYIAELDYAARAVVDAMPLDAEFGVGASPPGSAGGLPGLPVGPVLGMVSGDFNGDRILDVLIGRQQTYQLYFGIPEEP